MLGYYALDTKMSRYSFQFSCLHAIQLFPRMDQFITWYRYGFSKWFDDERHKQLQQLEFGDKFHFELKISGWILTLRVKACNYFVFLFRNQYLRLVLNIPCVICEIFKCVGFAVLDWRLNRLQCHAGPLIAFSMCRLVGKNKDLKQLRLKCLFRIFLHIFGIVGVSNSCKLSPEPGAVRGNE